MRKYSSTPIYLLYKGMHVYKISMEKKAKTKSYFGASYFNNYKETRCIILAVNENTQMNSRSTTLIITITF